MLNKSHYPSDYDGPLGIVECSICGVSLDVDEEAIQADWNNEFYCQDCYDDEIAALQEEEEDELE